MANDDSWFSVPGPYDDVILSTRVRLARNLADFPFLAKMSADDKRRVTSLVYDAVSSNESLTFIDFNQVGENGRDILQDKGIISNNECTAVIINADESTAIVVNDRDHVRIAGFASGLNCEKAMENVYKIDEFLQEKLQFAASYKFGYLTSHIKDSGSGMKISFYCFIPAVILDGKLEEVINYCHDHNFSITPAHKNQEEGADFGNCIFEVQTTCASRETELDQLAAIQSAGMYILQRERKIRKEYADNNPTVVLNFVKQALAKTVYSLLLSYEEGVNAFSGVKWGLQVGLLTGAEEKDINPLYFRTKNGHLKYLCDNYNFAFEEDIKNDPELQIERLRTIVIQQALGNIKIKD